MVNGRNTNPYQKTSLQNGNHKQKISRQQASIEKISLFLPNKAAQITLQLNIQGCEIYMGDLSLLYTSLHNTISTAS